MKNITINRQKKTAQLEKPISLTNGALVLLKHNGEIDRVFMVVSFRDNKNRYHGDSTEKYCSLLDLDSGYYAFEERASRKTTVRRVLNHVLRLGTNNYADTISDVEEAAVLGSTFRISTDCGVTFGPVYSSPVTSPHGPLELADGSLLWVGQVFGSWSHPDYNDSYIKAYRIFPDRKSVV